MIEVCPVAGVFLAEGRGEGHSEAKLAIVGEGDLDGADLAGDGVDDVHRDAVGVEIDAEVEVGEVGVGWDVCAVHAPLDVAEVEDDVDIFTSKALKDLCWNCGFIAHVDGDLAVFGILELVKDGVPAAAVPGGWTGWSLWGRRRVAACGARGEGGAGWRGAVAVGLGVAGDDLIAGGG